MRREREGGTPAAGSTSAADDRIADDEEAPERPALAGVCQLGLGASTSSRAGGASGYARGDAQTNAQSNRNRQLEIFEESPGTARRDGGDDQGNKVLWTNLGSQAATKRENQQQPSSWNTFRFPQQGGRAAAGPALDIPMDDDLVAGENAADPATAGIPRTGSDSQVSLPAFNPAIGYDAHLLQGPNGEERSFEEARAESWIAVHGIPHPLPNTAGVPPASMPAVPTNLTEAAAMDSVQEEEVQEDEGPSAGGAANTEATIHTREAFADIMSMFSERLPCDDDENMPKRKRKQGLSSSPVAKSERAMLAGPLGAATHAGGAATDFHIFDDAEDEAAPAAAAVQTKAAAESPAPQPEDYVL